MELEDLFIEGLVPMETLPGGSLHLSREHAQDHRASARGEQFSIGDKVRVRLDRVDAVEKKLQFSVVIPEGHRKSEGKRKKK